VWDARNFRRPVEEKGDLKVLYSGTNAIFSPDERHILTGCGVSQRGNAGKLVFLDRVTLEKVESVELDSTVVKVIWHPRINQVSSLSCLTAGV
jgi:WD repeat-containing protein 70